MLDNFQQEFLFEAVMGDTVCAEECYALINKLYPICRSITGDGVRQSLHIINEIIPLQVREVASGTPVFDWTVPNEWNIRDAWIRNPRGEKFVDFAESNLHVVNYSVPVRQRMPLAQLRPYLHTLPEQPDWIPYRTSYYRETWGFCLPHRRLQELQDGVYEVCIDATLQPGHLTYGELLIPGEREEEILFSAHICHPSLANDNLSGVSIATHLARELLSRDRRRYSYRFLFIPGTIGAITWLALNQEGAKRIRGGLTLVCLGDSQPLTYKKSFAGDALMDRAVCEALKDTGQPSQVIDFFPYGYDERQFNSPGFRIPVGSLMRGRHGQFPEYHTSADNLDFVSAGQLAGSYDLLHRTVDILENDRRYRNLFPFGEPQLGKRGIYREMADADKEMQEAMLWVLCCSDGQHSLLDICQRSGYSLDVIRRVVDVLVAHGLLQE